MERQDLIILVTVPKVQLLNRFTAQELLILRLQVQALIQKRVQSSIHMQSMQTAISLVGVITIRELFHRRIHIMRR